METTDLPKREEVEGDSMVDKMMRMCLSLRAELYDLYTKHQALLDENARLKATNIVSIKLKETSAEDKDAVSTETAPRDEPVLGSQQGERTQTLTLPTTEDASREADAGIVSGDEVARVVRDTHPPFHCPDDCRPEFRPMSPSEHGLAMCPPNVESINP